MKIKHIVTVFFAMLIYSSEYIADPIHEWAKLGNINKIKQYESMQAKQKSPINWDAKNAAGKTALMLASSGGHDQVAIFLLERNVDPAITDREGKTAFDYAQNELIKAALIKRSKTKNGQTLLTQTIKNGDERHFDALIVYKETDINKPNTQGQTPLHVAVLQDNKIESNKNIIQKLLRLCAIAVNVQDNEGDTPLHYAAIQGNVELVMTLAGAGAQATIVNKEGKKPRQLIGKKSKTMNSNEKQAIEAELKALEEHPVDIKHAKQHCISPAAGQGVDAAKYVKLGHDEVKIRTDHRKQQEKASLEYFDPETGQTLLTAAACQGNVANVTKIIQMGGLVNAPDNNVNTPLLTAVICYTMPINGANHFAVIDHLLKHGASVLIHDKDGKNPLHLAIEYENSPVVMLLLAHLSNNPHKAEIINAQDRNGDTPLHYAAATSNFNLVKSLLTYNANRDIQNNAKKYPRDVLASKESVDKNNRQNLAKNSVEIRQLLGAESEREVQKGVGSKTYKPSKPNMRTSSQIPIPSKASTEEGRTRAVSVIVNPTSESIAAMPKKVDAEIPKAPWGKPGIVTFDEETGDTHIEVPADDESDSDR